MFLFTEIKKKKKRVKNVINNHKAIFISVSGDMTDGQKSKQQII